MNKKVVLWIFVGVVVLIGGLLSGFVLLQPSAEDILISTLETMHSIQDGHAIFAFDADTIEKKANGTVELWGGKLVRRKLRSV